VTKDDLIRGALFPDAVCRVTAGVDVHALDPQSNRKTTSDGVRVRPYDIPLRSMIAADVDGLMLGRSISGDFLRTPAIV
jgi:hypothetical protein